jgi:SAM-dependent methyltransferase
MNNYGEKNWEDLWEQLEHEGNVGLDYVINPVLYPKIVDFLAEHPKTLVADFGCGTNVMGIQLLFGHQYSIAALKNIHNIDTARFNTLLYLGIEGSEELVRQSNKYFEDIGGPRNIATLNEHVGVELETLFDEESVDLCVSRNFLMHLSNADLDSHLAYVARMLKSGGKYIFATLNPDYELSKFGKPMENGQAYSFAHGKEGEYGTFHHYYRTIDYFNSRLSQYFSISESIDCLPVTDRFKDSHARYYNAELPMAKVYVLEVKK